MNSNKTTKILILIITVTVLIAGIPCKEVNAKTIKSFKSLLALSEKSYDFVNGFSEGIAMVSNEMKDSIGYGYVDDSGQEISPCKYYIGSLFSDGMARVGVKTKSGTINFGYINIKGKEIIGCKYENASDFIGGLSVVMNYKKQYALINKNGKEIVAFGKYDYIDVNTLSAKLISVTDYGDYQVGYRPYCGFVNRKGKEVVKPKYEDTYHDSFTEGLIFVQNDEKYGYIDITGKEIVPVLYDSISLEHFTEGYSVVEVDGKFGAVDYTGKIVIKPRYDDLRIYDKEYATYNVGYSKKEIKKNVINITPGVWGLMDVKGNIIIEPKYDRIGIFSNGLASVNSGGSFPSGSPGNGGTSMVAFSGGSWGFINEHGEVIVPLKYDDVNNFSEGLALVEKDDKYGFINVKGEEVISCIYDNAYNFTDGLAFVTINNKSGYIDMLGNVVVEIKYDEIGDFSMGLAPVKINNKWGFVKTSGEVVIPIQYEDTEFSNYYGFLDFPFSLAVLNGKEIFINVFGEELSKLGKITSLGQQASDGIFAFSVSRSGSVKYGYFDKNGKLILYPYYEYVSDIIDGIALVKIDGRLLFFKATKDGMKDVSEYYKAVKR